MSALEFELQLVGGAEDRRMHGAIVPPYEPASPADGPPVVIDLDTNDIVVEVEDGATGLPIILGEPVEEEPNIVRDRRDELQFVLHAFAEDLPVLKPGVQTLSLSVATALANLGCDIGEEHVRVMTVEPLRSLVRPLPSGTAGVLANGASQALAASLATLVTSTVGDLLHAKFGEALVSAIGHDASCDLGGLVMRHVTEPFRRQCIGRGDHLGDLAWKTLHEAHRLYIGCTLADRKAEKGLIAPFIELLRNGHFPVGFLSDGTFLVICD